MSKATELAHELDTTGRPGGLCGNAAAHLIALDASHRQLLESLVEVTSLLDMATSFALVPPDADGPAIKAKSAIAAAKELS